MDPRLVQRDGIRMFSDASIQEAIDRALAIKPPDGQVAAVAHVDGTGASVSLVVKVKDQWSVAAAAYKAYNQPLAFGGEIIWTP